MDITADWAWLSNLLIIIRVHKYEVRQYWMHSGTNATKTTIHAGVSPMSALHVGEFTNDGLVEFGTCPSARTGDWGSRFYALSGFKYMFKERWLASYNTIVKNYIRSTGSSAPPIFAFEDALEGFGIVP